MGNIEKRFKVTGMQYYEKDFFDKLSYENDDFELKPRELFDMYDENERIYQYSFEDSNGELIPEPDNENDPNAIAVVVGGCKIGYIKRGACSQAKNLLSSPNFIKVRVEMGGGKYKKVYEDEDGKVKVDRDSCGYFADVIIVMRSDEEDAPAPTAATSFSSAPVAAPTVAPAADKTQKKKGTGFIIGGVVCALIGLGGIGGGSFGGIVGVLIGAALIWYGLKRRKA